VKAFLFSALLLFGVQLAALAEAPPCKVSDPPHAKALPTLARTAQEIAKGECDAQRPSPRALSIRILELLQQADRELKAMGITEAIFPFSERVAAASKEVDAKDEAVGSMSLLAPLPGPASPGIGINLYGDARVLPGNEGQCDAEVNRAKLAGIQTCLQLLSALVDVYGHAQLWVQRRYTDRLVPFLALSEKQWDDFLTKSRSQTLLELVINSALWRRDSEKGKFLAPPSMQLIVLHPSIVLEHVSAETDGNRSKEGIIFEIIGANWWRQSEWYQPSGASLVAVYSDRIGVSDWGGGFAAHFGNKFTVGAVKRSGSTGIFISLDVLELVKDKKAMLDRYVSDLPKPR
jgi:hypothetical protein